MKIVSAKIRNFRKLENVTLSFDEKTTVIVGRNNTGKTSTAEIFRSFLSGNSPNLKYVDFCQSSFAKFINAAKEFDINSDDEVKVALLHKDLKCKAPLIEPNLRRNLGKWST